MIKVIVACGSGMGSSQMIKLKVTKILKKMGVEAQIHHTNIGEAKSTASFYNVVVCPANFEDSFLAAKSNGTCIIPLINLLDEKEIESKLTEANVANMN